MANTVGPQTGPAGGTRLSILAHGKGVRQKVGGLTVDWDSVTALADDTTYPDNVTVEAGNKVLPAGTVLLRDDATMTYAPATDTDTLVRGATFLVERLVVESDPKSAVIAGIDGGTVYGDRLQVGGTGQPTLADLLAVMPQLRVIEDETTP